MAIATEVCLQSTPGHTQKKPSFLVFLTGSSQFSRLVCSKFWSVPHDFSTAQPGQSPSSPAAVADQLTSFLVFWASNKSASFDKTSAAHFILFQTHQGSILQWPVRRVWVSTKFQVTTLHTTAQPLHHIRISTPRCMHCSLGECCCLAWNATPRWAFSVYRGSCAIGFLRWLSEDTSES